jgi:hypothetical protein
MDRVEATQRGRSTLNALIQELSSGCLVGDVSPVQASSAAPPGVSGSSGPSTTVNSDAQDLVFVTALGSGSSGTPVEHVVSFANHTITDSAYALASGSAPTVSVGATWLFATTPFQVRQLTNVVSASYQYYSFTYPSSNNNSLSGSPTALTLPLNATWPATTGETSPAPSVARVDITWQVGPTDGITSDAARLATMQDSVVFRLSPPTSSAPNLPCD